MTNNKGTGQGSGNEDIAVMMKMKTDVEKNIRCKRGHLHTVYATAEGGWTTGTGIYTTLAGAIAEIDHREDDEARVAQEIARQQERARRSGRAWGEYESRGRC